MRKAFGKTKPADLFIHPNHSNIARADAISVELGLRCQKESSQAQARLPPRMSSDSDDSEMVWERGRGPEAARAVFGVTPQTRPARTTNVRPDSRSDSQGKLFQVGDSDSESDG
jgi:hypothetical protein